MMDVSSGASFVEGEEDVWGGMEVQENIIEQLLEGPHSAPLEKTPSSRRVRFTANSTLAVYASEKSLSTEDGSDEEQEEDEYEEEEDEEEEEEEDEEDEEEGTSSDSDGEGYSDDEVVINDIVVNDPHSKDSLELPFIHSTRMSSSTTTTTTTTTNTNTPNTPNTSNTDAPSINPSHTTTNPSAVPDGGPPFSKDALHVQVEQPSLEPQPTQEAAQRGWAQRRQGIQRYTPKYSPKSSPTSATGELLPTSADTAGNLNLNSSATIPQSENTQQSPLIPKALRATQELHQELARAKEASVNLTMSSARLEESMTHLKDRIALSRQLLSALGCILHFGSSIVGLRLVQSIFLSPSIPSASTIQMHSSLLLTTALASTLVNQYLTTTAPSYATSLTSTDTTNEASLSRTLDGEKTDKKSYHETDTITLITTGWAKIATCAVVVRWLIVCCRQS